jgi:hypothetical protein
VTILTEPPTPSATQLLLAEALLYQAKSDSLKNLAINATIMVRESEDPNDRWVWQKQILLWEKKSRDQQEIADELYARHAGSLKAQQQWRAGKVPETIRVDTVVGGMTVYRFTGTSELEGEPGTAPALVQAGREVEPVINRFDILNYSPYSPDHPVPMDVPIPQGAFYRIQLGVYSSEVEQAVFQGISPITGERIEDRGFVKYYAGKFSRYQDASTALAKVQSKGFEDAFIVAWYNGNPITTQKAKQLE